MIGVVPVFDRIDITKIAIDSFLALDPNFSVLGVTDGPIPGIVARDPDRYQHVHRDHGYLAANALNRIEVGLVTGEPWIYLFDSDAIHLPTAVSGLETLMKKLKFKEIGSLYVSPVYRSVHTIGVDIDRTHGLGGISMLMRRDTAEFVMEQKGEILARASKGHYDWDNFLSRITLTFRTRVSHVEHLGAFTGANGAARKKRGIVERALNIDRESLRKTLERFNLSLSDL